MVFYCPLSSIAVNVFCGIKVSNASVGLDVIFVMYGCCICLIWRGYDAKMDEVSRCK